MRPCGNEGEGGPAAPTGAPAGPRGARRPARRRPQIQDESKVPYAGSRARWIQDPRQVRDPARTRADGDYIARFVVAPAAVDRSILIVRSASSLRTRCWAVHVSREVRSLVRMKCAAAEPCGRARSASRAASSPLPRASCPAEPGGPRCTAAPLLVGGIVLGNSTCVSSVPNVCAPHCLPRVVRVRRGGRHRGIGRREGGLASSRSKGKENS
jgi:hypothetical protein